MDKIKQYKIIIITILFILVISFYWFQLRPTQIRISCEVKVQEMRKTGKDVNGRYSAKLSIGDRETVDGVYNDCLRRKGL